MYRTKCFTCFTVKVFGVFSTLAPLYAWDCVFVAESGESPCGYAYCDTVLCLRLVKVCVPFSRCEPVHNNHAELMSRSAWKVWQSVAVCFRFGPARRPDGKQECMAALELIRPLLCNRQRPTTTCGPSPSRSSRPRPRTRACVTSSPCSASLRTVPSSRWRWLTTCTPMTMLRSGETNGWKVGYTLLSEKSDFLEPQSSHIA